MRFQNKQLAYLNALTLLLSYVEMILPRVVPFFRLGLANSVILLAFDINFGSFMILAVLKATAASLMGGTLISPFFLISLVQSVVSALVMRLLYKLISKKVISLYGISIAGSAISAVIQIGLAALYIGSGTFTLLGPMLIFNTVSGIITALFAEKSGIKDSIKIIEENEEDLRNSAATQSESASRPATQLLPALLLIILSASAFFIKDLRVLCGALFAALIIQRAIFKRKIYILPHISLWLFIFISTGLIPNGKVIFKIWNISITQGALLLAAQKALTLSTVSAFSQCAVCLKPAPETLLGKTLEYYRQMSDRYRNSEGSVFKRIGYALNTGKIS